ncbi:MAG TPA: HdeD family acid-resistance protein [Allocoleopsis sp.]
MTIHTPPPEIREDIRKSSAWLIVGSILLLLAGIAAILMPIVTTLATTLFLGWVLIIAGGIRIFKAFQSKPIRGFWLSLIVGVLYILAGFSILSNILAGAITLTILLGIIFIVEGIIEIIAAFQAHTGQHLSWLVLADGVITLILGILIFNLNPVTSLGIIGLYVGISFLFSGSSLLAIALATRKAIG